MIAIPAQGVPEGAGPDDQGSLGEVVRTGPGPVLLAPPMSGDPDSVSAGLVLDSRSLGPGVRPRSSADTQWRDHRHDLTGPPRSARGMGGSETIGGRTVRVVMDLGESRWGYGVSEGCYDVRVTTSAGLEPSRAR